jgi:hypothetical protein
LVAFSPYSNGSYVISTLNGSSQAFILYCCCGKPQVSSQWKSSELKRYAVSSPAYQRGYGTPEEVVGDGEMKKANLRSR